MKALALSIAASILSGNAFAQAAQDGSLPLAVDIGVQSRARQPGEALLVVVAGAEPKTPPAGKFEGKALRFFPGGQDGRWLALVGLDLELKPGPHTLSLEVAAPGQAPKPWSTAIDVAPKEFPTRTLTVEEKYVAPPKEDEERAEREAKMLSERFAASEDRRYFEGRFKTPIQGAAVSRFGERSVFNGVPKAPHSGADLKAKTGVKVRAPQGGKVIVAQNLFYQGNCVFLDHGYGLVSGYFHLSELDVKEGDVVKPGQLLGRVGRTGRATGPHLHWSVKAGGARVDPFSLTALDLDRWLSSGRQQTLTKRP